MEAIKTQAPVTAQHEFLAQLREATAREHKALEATPLSMALMSKDLGADDYLAYLLHMRDVIFFCEQSVFPVVQPLLADLHLRHKLAAIEQDIEMLAGQVALTAYVPPFKPAIPAGNVAFAMGFMYVVEGSTLGGRVLLKHVQEVLSVDERSGAGFFAGYGTGTGALWKEFIRVLGDYAVANDCGKQIVAGAQYAFNVIEHHFAQNS